MGGKREPEIWKITKKWSRKMELRVKEEEKGKEGNEREDTKKSKTKRRTDNKIGKQEEKRGRGGNAKREEWTMLGR